MAKPLPQPLPTPKRCFTVAQNDTGQWIARDRGGLERFFPDQRSALHFVLFELGERATAALLDPRR